MRAGRASLPLALLAASLLAGCGQTEAHRVVFSPGLAGPGAGPGAGQGEAEIVLGALPERPFSEIGLVEATGYGTDADPDVALKALRREARKMGCDAVVKVRVDAGNTAAHAVGVCVAWR